MPCCTSCLSRGKTNRRKPLTQKLDRISPDKSASRLRRWRGHGKSLGHTLHHELDILRGFRDKRFETGMRGFKCEPAFVSGLLEDGKGLLRPFDGHHSLRHRASWVLFQ